MNWIIAGSRTFTNYEKGKKIIEEIIEKAGQKPTAIICGMARGADEIGYIWAKENKIKIIEMPAKWETEGISAGHKRNVRMAEIASAVILMWDGKSKGSAGMKKIAEKKGIRIFEKII